MNDEKKKIAIVGALVAVMACVGAFQLLGGKKAPAPPAAPLTTEAPKPVAMTTKGPGKVLPDGTAVEPPVNPEVANDLPVRDPFKPPPGALPPTPKAGGPVPFQRFPQRFGGGPKPVIPNFPGALGQVGSGSPQAGGLAPIGAVAPEHPFAYHLVGEIGGDSPAALFEDAAGNQKLVRVGSAVDGDAKLKSMGRGSVIIEFRGKKLRLSMGGTPVGK